MHSNTKRACTGNSLSLSASWMLTPATCPPLCLPSPFPRLCGLSSADNGHLLLRHFGPIWGVWRLTTGGVQLIVASRFKSNMVSQLFSDNDHGRTGTASYMAENQKTSLPLSLDRLEDSDGLNRIFLCCYVDFQTRVYDCEELAAMPVPPQFIRVKELLGIEGDLKKVFGPQGMIFSYDADGKIRMWTCARFLT